MPLKPSLPALIVRGALDDLQTIRQLAEEPEAVRSIAGGTSARLERALEELARAEAEAAWERQTEASNR